MQVLYDYIVHPIRTLQRNSIYSVKLPSLLVLALLAFPSVGHFSGSFIIEELFWMMVIGSAILLQSMTMDFFAQLLGYPSQSFKLFQWLSLSYLPWLTLIPLGVLFGSSGLNAPWLLSLSYFAAQLAVLYLQLMTVKQLYHPSKWGIFGMYIFPYLLMIGGMILFILFVLSLFPASFWTL